MSDVNPVGGSPVGGTGPKGIGGGEPTNSEISVLSDNEEVVETGLEEGTVTDDEVEEDEGKEVGEGKEGEETGEEEEEEEEETEEEEEEETEETEEEELNLSSWQLIKEKYPELTKNRDFKRVFFGYNAYSNLFPGGMEEAKEMSEKSRVFDALDAGISDGDPTIVFKSLSEEVLGKLSAKFLPTLYKHNPKYFAVATRPVITELLNHAHDYAIKVKDENLRKSVRNLSNYLTGSPDIPKNIETREDPEVENERRKLLEERKQLFLRDQSKFLEESDGKIGTRLFKLISADLDPENKLTDFAKEAIVERTLADIKEKLISDEQFVKRMQSLNTQSARSRFDGNSANRITSAYIGAAKRLIPVYLRKHKNAALGITTTKNKTKETKVVSKNERITTGGNKAGETSTVTNRQVDKRKTSELDFLNDKIVYRK